MNKSSILTLTASLLLASGLASCSKDEYDSQPPRFSGMEVNVLSRDANGNLVSTNSDEVHVGDYFTVTARQRTIGKLLNTSKYTWSNSQNFSQRYRPSVIYDNYEQNFNPADTLYASAAGTCKVTFTGKYNASGDTQKWASDYGSTSSETLTDGSKVTYTVGGIFYFTVTAECTLNIKP